MHLYCNKDRDVHPKTSLSKYTYTDTLGRTHSAFTLNQLRASRICNNPPCPQKLHSSPHLPKLNFPSYPSQHGVKALLFLYTQTILLQMRTRITHTEPQYTTVTMHLLYIWVTHTQIVGCGIFFRLSTSFYHFLPNGPLGILSSDKELIHIIRLSFCLE